MLFNSFDFAIYLPIVFFIYWFVFGEYSILKYVSSRVSFLKPFATSFSLWHNNLKLQNAFIVAASYLFYGWWDWRFLLLIFFTSICSWSSGLLINQYRNTPIAKRISAANIVLNLLILGFFKYFNFFVDSFTDSVTFFGGHLDSWTLKILLPVGISFYTFQALSYSIDVYRNKMTPTKDLIAFLAYVSFFPQLVAGPIERATNLLPQFYKKRKFNDVQAIDGLLQILWGFFKKLVIADNCAVYVNQVWENYSSFSSSTLLLACILFSFQIYGDFSGYSDIAIGIGKLFGITLMRNFHVPYFSRNIGEFWRRWHISLTTWFKDYLYFPLGGSRLGKNKTIRNTFIIFLVSGFWHGANWTFLLWGFFHAILFLPSLVFGKNRKYAHTKIAEDRMLPSTSEFMLILWTFILTTLGWIIFRAPDINTLVLFTKELFSSTLFSLPSFVVSRRILLMSILGIIICILVEWKNRDLAHPLSKLTLNKPLNYFFVVVLCLLINLNLGSDQAFIYFQF